MWISEGATVDETPSGSSPPQTKPLISTTVAANREDCIVVETRVGLTVGGLNREERLVFMGGRGVRLGGWSWEPRGSSTAGGHACDPPRIP